MHRLQAVLLKRIYLTMFCKIKKIFFCFVFACLSFPVFSQVQVEELSESTLDLYGLNKSLAFVSWGNVPFEQLSKITKELSEQGESSVLANLTAAVLIQPTFISPSNWEKQDKENWLILRLQSLMNLGRPDLVLELIENLPNKYVSLPIKKIQMEAYFLSDDWKKGCGFSLLNASEDIYFNQMQILCLKMLDEKDKALMAFDLFREEYPDEKEKMSFVQAVLDDRLSDVTDLKNLQLSEIFVLKHLKSPLLTEDVLPIAWKRKSVRTYSGFGNAVNVKKLFELWGKTGLSSKDQAYRFYLFSVYAKLFLPNMNFIKENAVQNISLTEQNFSLDSLLLKDKEENQITGFDLLMGLWLLSVHSLNIENALLLLNKGGLHLDNYILERLNP